ncbi:MAG TPA: hypothetical protein VGV61_07720, partial [Thermoanaerobaculia bacterium]|nr:hypothetical protein [Thermoanaerobaculia bacterium]
GLGVLSEADLAATVVDLANQCLVGLDGEALLAAPARGGWESWYTCGPMLLFVADRAVETAHPGEGGVGLLVRHMFEEGGQAGNVYGTGVFLGWLDKLAGNREVVFALQRMIRRGVATGADRFLVQLLQGAGYRVVLAPPEESQASFEVFRTLLHSGLVRCGAPERVVRVGDVETRADPAAAYAHLRAAARRGQPLRVVADDDPQPITLLCGRETIDASFEQLLKAE